MLGQIPMFTETFFPAEGKTYLDLLSKIGFIYATFMCGVKMDPKMVLKCGRKAFTIGVTTVMVPLALFSKYSKVLDLSGIHRYRRLSVKAIFSIQFLSSFPVTAALLVDLKIINSELGRLALATALVGDLVSNGVSTIFSIMRIASMTSMPILSLHSLVLTTAFVVVTFIVVRPLSARVIKMTPEGRPVDVSFVIFMTFFVLFTVMVTDNVGISYQYGPFLLGLVVPDGPPLGSTLVDKLDTIISGLFAPLFLTYCGLKVNLVILFDLEFAAVIWVTIALSFLSKYFTVLLTSLACNVPPKDAASLAFMMNTQGFIQMSFYFNNVVNQVHSITFKFITFWIINGSCWLVAFCYTLGYGCFLNCLFLIEVIVQGLHKSYTRPSPSNEMQTFDGETFSMLTSSVIVTAAASYIFVGFLHDYSKIYAGYRKRNIENSSLTSELRILSCAYRPDDVLAAKKLLDASFPCKESPISVYALHLVEQVGQATPLLIDHQLGQKHSSQVSNARSQKILDMFQSFEMQHSELATVQFFTAISMLKFMHHDICSLAFDKLTFFIMLPFHRRWNQQGRMVSDSTTLRTINCNVLDMAPCSVGILIDRHKIRKKMPGGPSAYQVAVIFIGGSDDREALAYGRRMSMSPEVQFTLMRLVPLNPDMAESQWDTVLDAEMLKSVRVLEQQRDNVVYREERVTDGAESALILHAMEEAFDLILVGRRHKDKTPQLSGLTEWNDLPELGPLGDMLAAADINFPVSVLVCQQQPYKHK